jgi:rhamnosyltransferase
LQIETPPKIAILLAAYNGTQWIEEQVTSIIEQKDVDVTLFISVDLSTDDTHSWCLQLAERDSRVKVLPYGERFGGAGKNFYRLIRDVDFEEFDYVSLADQDDIWLPNKLLHAVSMIREKSLDAYSSDVLAFWEDRREEVIVKSQPQKPFDYIFEAAGPGCSYVLTVASFLKFKTFLVNNNLAYDFRLHDWLIYAFYRKHGLKWFIDDEPLMRYRQHANNQVGFNKGWKAYKTRISQVRDKRFRGEVEKLLDLLGCPDGFKLSRGFLIFNFYKLRRRARDAYVLLAFNILGWF